MGENEQGGMLRVVVVLGLIAIIAMTVIFGVTGLKSHVDETRTDAVNNVTMAGQNLLLGTKDYNKVPYFGKNDKWHLVGYYAPDKYQGLSVIENYQAWSGPMYYVADLERRGLIKLNDTYVMSEYLRNTSSKTVSIYFYAQDSSRTTNRWVADLPPHSDWVRVQTPPFKFIKDKGFTDEVLSFQPIVWVEEAGKIQQAGMKLEKGTMATDYSPAPGE